ncbi:MAG: hypothetical protein AAGF47_05650 [Planctomycetota bacterium]
MRRSIRTARALAASALMGLAATAGTAAAQQDDAAPVESQLRDFIFFVNVNRDDAAALQVDSVLDSGVTPAELLEIVERERLESDLARALNRAAVRAELEPSTTRLRRMLETARLQRARNDEEITRNIEQLTGTLRQRRFATERLAAAGEYAMPRLLDALLDRRDPARRTAVQQFLVAVKQPAVVPLSTALLGVDPASQQLIASILGELGYRSAAPYLAELGERTEDSSVSEAVDRALAALGVGDASAASLHAGVAEAYYDERDDLTSFRGEPIQLLWDYQPAQGLTPRAIDTAVFHEAMSMMHAERAMQLGGRRGGALGLWVAANFSREIDEPAGYDNPAYPPSMREAMYYAVASGPAVGERVLARAIEDRDTPLARRAVEAIRRTAGPNTLWSRGSNQGAMVAALGYPSRRVQYDAALALAAALPEEEFVGSERVIPTLTSALRFSGQTFAVVLADDQERYTSYRRLLEDKGYAVLPFGRGVEDIFEALVQAPGIDLVVAQAPRGETRRLIESVRSEPRLAAVPILSLAQTDELPRLRQAYDREGAVTFRSLGASADGISETIDALVDVAAGGVIEPDEALAYASSSVAAMRDLAVARNEVLDVSSAAPSLIDAMAETDGEVRLRIAEVLSMIDRPDAQSALAQTALESLGTDRVALLGWLAASARRNGNLLGTPAIEGLIELADTGADDEATAAAAVIGALGISQRDLVRLILADG